MGPDPGMDTLRRDETRRDAPELGRFGIFAVLLDAQPPGLFFSSEPPQYVPTVEFSVHFTLAPAPARHSWYVVEQKTVWASYHYCVEESTVHDARGLLHAQARQTRRVMRD